MEACVKLTSQNILYVIKSHTLPLQQLSFLFLFHFRNKYNVETKKHRTTAINICINNTLRGRSRANTNTESMIDML